MPVLQAMVIDGQAPGLSLVQPQLY